MRIGLGAFGFVLLISLMSFGFVYAEEPSTPPLSADAKKDDVERMAREQRFRIILWDQLKKCEPMQRLKLVIHGVTLRPYAMHVVGGRIGSQQDTPQNICTEAVQMESVDFRTPGNFSWRDDRKDIVKRKDILAQVEAWKLSKVPRQFTISYLKKNESLTKTIFGRERPDRSSHELHEILKKDVPNNVYTYTYACSDRICYTVYEGADTIHDLVCSKELTSKEFGLPAFCNFRTNFLAHNLQLYAHLNIWPEQSERDPNYYWGMDALTIPVATKAYLESILE